MSKRSRLTDMPDNEAQVLRVDKLLGADIAAFFDTSSGGKQADMNFSIFGGANVQGFTSQACVRSWPPLGNSAVGPDRSLSRSRPVGFRLLHHSHPLLRRTVAAMISWNHVQFGLRFHEPRLCPCPLHHPPF